MWVAGISQSLLTASLAAVTGILFTAGAVFYYATVEPDAQGRTQRQGPVGEAPRFGGADLRWADLRRVDLRDANLRAVDFTGACLRAADLRGADLTDAVFTNADVAGTRIDNEKQILVPRNWPSAPPTPSPCDD